MSDLFDAVIVGSGAGGGAAAWKLARAGMRVCVLERGPDYSNRDYIHDELAICRRNFWTPDPARDPHMLAREGKPAQPSAETWIATCVGGGTVHMGGYFFRMHAEDFQPRARWGDISGANIADWPFGLKELLPYYREAEQVIGLSGGGPPYPENRSEPFPTGPLLTHPSAELIDGACRKLGIQSFQTPRAILSADDQGRDACRYCGYCGSYGCEAGAKSSTQVTFLAQAARTGKLKLFADTTVTGVTLNKKGVIQGVLARGEKGGTKEIRGRVVILACSAIETARLMLNCTSAAYPHGLANGSGYVGKNLMFSAFAGGRARFPYRTDSFPEASDRLPFLDRTSQEFYLSSEPGTLGGTLQFQRAHFNPIFLAERAARDGSEPPVFGEELQRRLREAFLDTRTVEWEAFSPFLPHAACEVSLDPAIKDPHGRAIARVKIAVHPRSRASVDALAEKGRAVLAAAGGQGHARYDEDIYPVLQAGTARMGTDPNHSVLAPDCRAHEISNLYVADSSSFPQIGGAPFTLTILANALRVADGIAARARRREL